MKIEFRHSVNSNIWRVCVDGEDVAYVWENSHAVEWEPRIKIDSNFPIARQIEIKQAIDEFIALQRITSRLKG